MAEEVVLSTAELGQVVGWFEQRHRSLGEVTPVIAQILVTAVNDVFEAEGPGWEQLKQSTLDKRRLEGRGAKILQNTTNLVGSIHGEHGPDFAEAATNVPYIVYHLDGGPVIPKRNPFEVNADQVLDDTVELLLNALTGGGN